MTDRTDRWSEFVDFCSDLRARQKQGRPSLRRRWSALRDLYREVLPALTATEIHNLLGKRADELDPEENDFKAVVAHAAGRGLVDPTRLRSAMAESAEESPLYFLAAISGKAFGETVAPAVCEFWLRAFGDGWDKRPATDWYDILWTPCEGIGAQRIELKASSESPEFRYQQIRDPRIGPDPSSGSYDSLLCLGVTATSVEFWFLPANEVSKAIDTGVMTFQHGGQKAGLQSNTYWITMTREARAVFQNYGATPEELRELGMELLRGKGA